MPADVRALIRRRVANLAREAVAVLRVAAVIGREFDLYLLQRTSRLTPARFVDVLGDAVALGVIAELPATPRRYSFAHELVRETLYDDLPPARRLKLHREVGRLLESLYGEDLHPHLSEIARHLYLAAPLGDADQALEYLVRAGDRAAALFAYEEAAVHYRRALELLPLVGAHPMSGAASSCCASGTRSGALGTAPGRVRPSRRRSRVAAGSTTASCSPGQRWAM